MGDDVKNGSGRREKSVEIGVGDGRSHKKRQGGGSGRYTPVSIPRIYYI